MSDHRTTRRVAVIAGAAALGVAALLVLPAAGFAADGDDGDGGSPTDAPDAGFARHRHHGPRLTDEQRDCLEEQGITRPDERPTRAERVELRRQLRDAAQECGIELPLRGGRGPGCAHEGPAGAEDATPERTAA